MQGKAYANQKKTLPSNLFKAGERIEYSKFLIFNRTKKVDVNLPISMHNDMLLILGDEESHKRHFTRYYSQVLANNGKKIIYISDSLNSGSQPGDTIKNFKESAKATAFELGQPIVDEILIESPSISLVEFSSSFIKYFKETQIDEYNEKLVMFLEELSLRTVDELRDYVLVIEEAYFSSRDSASDIQFIISQIHALGVGIVLCSNNIARYNVLAKKARHCALFKLLDPLYELENLGYQSLICGGENVKSRMCYRDFKSIGSTCFYYFDRDNF